MQNTMDTTASMLAAAPGMYKMSMGVAAGSGKYMGKKRRMKV